MRANGFTIPVLHAEWKSLKPVKIVTTLNKESGEIEELLVDESYTLNKEAGDISIKTYWIPFKYEGYKYAVPNVTNQDIKIAVNCINNEKILSKVVGFKPIEFYVNGYGVLCLRL